MTTKLIKYLQQSIVGKDGPHQERLFLQRIKQLMEEDKHFKAYLKRTFSDLKDSIRLSPVNSDTDDAPEAYYAPNTKWIDISEFLLTHHHPLKQALLKSTLRHELQHAWDYWQMANGPIRDFFKSGFDDLNVLKEARNIAQCIKTTDGNGINPQALEALSQNLTVIPDAFYPFIMPMHKQPPAGFDQVQNTDTYPFSLLDLPDTVLQLAGNGVIGLSYNPNHAITPSMLHQQRAYYSEDQFNDLLTEFDIRSSESYRLAWQQLSDTQARTLNWLLVLALHSYKPFCDSFINTAEHNYPSQFFQSKYDNTTLWQCLSNPQTREQMPFESSDLMENILQMFKICESPTPLKEGDFRCLLETKAPLKEHTDLPDSARQILSQVCKYPPNTQTYNQRNPKNGSSSQLAIRQSALNGFVQGVVDQISHSNQYSETTQAVLNEMGMAAAQLLMGESVSSTIMSIGIRQLLQAVANTADCANSTWSRPIITASSLVSSFMASDSWWESGMSFVGGALANATSYQFAQRATQVGQQATESISHYFGMTPTHSE